jgi:hypothetical protein
VFVNQGKSWSREISMVEMRLYSRDSAVKVRNSSVVIKKGGEDFGKIHIANSVCLAPRVRGDMLRTFSKQLMMEGGESIDVMAYSSHPVHHIKDKTGIQKPYALTFANAVKRYSEVVNDDMLGEAYRKASISFKGKLEQHVVLLRESGIQGKYQQGQGQQNQQRKRPLEMHERVFQPMEPMATARGRGRGKV